MCAAADALLVFAAAVVCDAADALVAFAEAVLLRVRTGVARVALVAAKAAWCCTSASSLEAVFAPRAPVVKRPFGGPAKRRRGTTSEDAEDRDDSDEGDEMVGDMATRFLTGDGAGVEAAWLTDRLSKEGGDAGGVSSAQRGWIFSCFTRTLARLGVLRGADDSGGLRPGVGDGPEGGTDLVRKDPRSSSLLPISESP